MTAHISVAAPRWQKPPLIVNALGCAGRSTWVPLPTLRSRSGRTQRELGACVADGLAARLARSSSVLPPHFDFSRVERDIAEGIAGEPLR